MVFDKCVATVVEDLDVVEDIGPGQLPSLVDALADALLIQAAKEGLRDGIVPTVAAPAHAADQVVLAQEWASVGLKASNRAHRMSLMGRLVEVDDFKTSHSAVRA